MALSEEQILRYSRQILLKEVGGVGQERLRDNGAALTGTGSAQLTAAAYLGAGGSALGFSNRKAQAGEEGFLLSAADVGQPLREPLSAALEDVNPDALEPGEGQQGRVGELPASFGGPPPWVVIGWSGRKAGVVFRSEDGCGACFVENGGQMSKLSHPGASSVMAGAVAALAYQRMVLGISPPLGGVWVEEDGTLTPFELRKCQSCQAKG
ncbi:MAG TPA: ThiF family adenylyltransferase [Myxococcaceae bacterium]|nr:ThiF family adenylyltransferase [Myxococcaceae bacterium]